MEEEDPEGQGKERHGDNWHLFTQLVQAVWKHGSIPQQLLWIIVLLIPKGDGDYHGIGLLKPIWKVLERIMDHQINAIELHDCHHGCHANRCTGTVVIKAKLAQQLLYLELKPFFSIFLDLKKAFNLMNSEHCFLILEGCGAGPRMIRLIRTFWRNAIMMYQASGNNSMSFLVGRSMAQSGPLSAKLFNILVDAVACKWFWALWGADGYNNDKVGNLMATFFAIFYGNDAYLASRDAEFLQHAYDLLVDPFKRVGLKTNTSKMQTMICTPGWIWTQLPTDTYRWLQRGRVTTTEWNARDAECPWCRMLMKAFSSLGRYLVDIYDVYQQMVVAEELLELHPTETYGITNWSPTGLACLLPGCDGILRNEWMMRQHSLDIHPMDLVKVLKEGRFPRCWRCGMQVDPRYPHHPYTKECQRRAERGHQWEAAVASALALRQQFSMRGDILELVKVFKYLGHLLLQNNNDVQAISNQLRKAAVLCAENIAPCIAAKF
jgi:hypothetical protein